MSLGRLSRLFSSTPFPSFPFFVSGHWSAPSSPPSDKFARSQAKRGSESFAVGDHDCRILILKMNVHIFRSLVEKKKKKSWPTQGLPNKISWGSGTSLASHSSWSFSQKNTNQPKQPIYQSFKCKIRKLGTGRWENPYQGSSFGQDILRVVSFRGLSDSQKLAGCSHCIKLDYMGKNSWSECHLSAAAVYQPTLRRQLPENPIALLKT